VNVNLAFDPVPRAYDRVRDRLWRGQTDRVTLWFNLAFAAWLATTMVGKLSGYAFRMVSGLAPSFVSQLNLKVPSSTDDLNQQLQTLTATLQQLDIPALIRPHLVWYGAGAGVGALVAAGLLYLKARAQFVFLAQAVRHDAAFGPAWRQFRRQGHSLYGWYLGFGFVKLVTWVVLAAVGYQLVLPALHQPIDSMPILSRGCVGALIALPFWLGIVCVDILAGDFVVPLMCRFEIGVLAAWKHLLHVVVLNLGLFIAYAVVRAFLVMLAWTLFLLAACICCCLFCLADIPYISTVVVLPIPFFLRYFSLEFLAQFAPEYNLFDAPPKPATPPAMPNQPQVQP